MHIADLTHDNQRVSSVSTNLVLTTRKALSLLFSVWWFGNGFNGQLGTGAGMVFLGSILYTLGTRRQPSPQPKEKAKTRTKALEREQPLRPEQNGVGAQTGTKVKQEPRDEVGPGLGLGGAKRPITVNGHANGNGHINGKSRARGKQKQKEKQE